MSPNYEKVAYNACAFVCSLFVLEKGADKFVDHTAVVGRRTGVPQGVIALLTAGAEWEELAVVVVSIARKRSSLAVGNVVGSSISNILGAFSLGLLLASKPGGSSSKNNAATAYDLFDRSSRIYTLILLGITLLTCGFLAFPQARGVNWKILGGVLIGIFALYVASIAYTISRGVMAEPEGSDSDSDSDDGDSTDTSDDDDDDERRPLQGSSGGGASYGTAPSPRKPVIKKKRRSLFYHLTILLLGFLAVLLSSFVLSESATAIIDEIGLSDVLFGIVVLSIATTLPEKFIAVTSARRNHLGIMCANTVGSNIFLLSLCLGVTWSATDGKLNADSVNVYEVVALLLSTLLMAATVFFGSRYARPIGAAMLVAYVAFIAAEFQMRR